MPKKIPDDYWENDLTLSSRSKEQDAQAEEAVFKRYAKKGLSPDIITTDAAARKRYRAYLKKHES